MVLYLLIYALLLVMCFRIKHNEYFLLIAMIGFALLIGFRGVSVGADTLEYFQMYYRIGRRGSIGGETEVLYGLSNIYAYKIGLSFKWFQTLLVFISLTFCFKSIKKYSSHHGLSVFFLFALYFIFYAMNIYREMIACFIAVSALPLLNNLTTKQTFKYLCLTLLAMGFHSSALIILPLLFVNKLDLGTLQIYFLFLVTLLLGIFLPSNFLEGYLGGYDHLVDSSVNYRSEHDLSLAIFLAVYWMIEFFLVDIFSSKKFKQSVYFKIIICAVLINNLLVKQALGLRIVLYFNIIQIIALPILLQSVSKDQLLKKFILIAYISIFFFVFLLSNSAGVVPYEIMY